MALVVVLGGIPLSLPTGIATEAPGSTGAPSGVLGSLLDRVRPGHETRWAGAAADDMQAPASEPYPDWHYRDFYPACDINGDGSTDLVYNEWNPPYYTSRLRAVSGADGGPIWTAAVLVYHRLSMWRPAEHGGNPELAYHAPARPGQPAPFWPLAPENAVPAPDADGDGVCDFLILGMRDRPYSDPTGSYMEFPWVLQALSGRTGAVIWYHDIPTTLVEVSRTEDDASSHIYEMTDFPTGFFAFAAPDGPRFLVKTTDLSYSRDDRLYVVREQITLGMLRDGSRLWTRALLPSASPAPPVATWITGVADLNGDQHPEIVLDQARYGTGDTSAMKVMALRGEPSARGEDFWGAKDYYSTPHRGSLSLTEETQEVVLWPHVHLVPDFTGDAAPEVVASYLSAVVDSSEATTIAGAYRTHYVPLHGANGTRLWPPPMDIKHQGWGFADVVPLPAVPSSELGSLHNGALGPLWSPVREFNLEPEASTLVIGSIDMGSGAGANARFPKKDVRISVIQEEDGTPLWTTALPFNLDSFLSGHLALWQFLERAAVLPAPGAEANVISSPTRSGESYRLQTLLANMRHSYDLLGHIDGRTQEALSSWGANARIIACPGEAPGKLTALAGFARRLELVRFDAQAGTVLWRHTVHLNRALVSQTHGYDTAFWGVRCHDAGGRTTFGMSIGLLSAKRGFEIVTPAGVVNADGTLSWVRPDVGAAPPLQPSLNLTLLGSGTTAAPDHDRLWVFGPVVPGAAVGLAWNYRRFHRRM